MSPEARKSAANGIWCCANHGRLIDTDEANFTAEKLRQWKSQAEEASYRALVAGERSLVPVANQLEETEASYVRQLGLGPDDALAPVMERSRMMVGADLGALKRSLKTPGHSVALNLRLLDRDSEPAFTVDGMASAIPTFNDAVVVAPPGTGKTTTMLLAAEAMQRMPDLVPLFVPLGEWSAQGATLFASILRRQALRGLTENHLRLLAIHGRLVLLLDGWNELDIPGRQRLAAELKGLRRDFSALTIIVSTRRQALDVPLSGPTIEIEPLTESQQLQIAAAIRGEAGRTLLEQVWRTPGIRQLATIPLYLATLLVRAEADRLPSTKEEVLRMFIEQHEQDPEKAVVLREATQDRHADYLERLAVEATRRDSVSLTETDARRVVAFTAQVLVEAGQVAPPGPQPAAILDALVSHHLLVRTSNGGAYSFQHQQFQEYFAAAHVEKHMRATAAGDAEARQVLRREILDRHSWEEAILFACERCSRLPDGVDAVATTIRETLTIDPMLAAEIIFRSSEPLWRTVEVEVATFATRWHEAGRVDRAFRFMVKTGRPEFSELVWPLLSHPNDQVHLKALRAAERFRVSVLGPERERLLSEVPAEVRRHILSELCMYGGFEGIELATMMAERDDDARVRVNVIESLLFRRAAGHADRVLRTSPEEVWQRIAERIYPDDDLREMSSAPRLQEIWEKRTREITEPMARLSLFVHAQCPADAAELRALIADLALPMRGTEQHQRIGTLLYEAQRKNPDALHDGLVARAVQGGELPFRAYEYLLESKPATDDGPIQAIVLDASAETDRTEFAAKLVGPDTITRLIDQAIELDARLRDTADPDSRAVDEELRRVENVVAATRVAPFVAALARRSGVNDPHAIVVLAELISRHGHPLNQEALQLPAALRTQLVPMFTRFADVLLAAPGMMRAQFARLAVAMGRIDSPEFLQPMLQLLERDLAIWRAQRAEALAARRAGRRPPNESYMSYVTQYRRAFASLQGEKLTQAMVGLLRDSGHEGFGETAAFVLLDRWAATDQRGRERFHGNKAQFAEAEERRAERSSLTSGAPIGDAIFDVVESLLQPDAELAQLQHALKLARVAVTMPYVRREALIERLLAVPVPNVYKFEFLAALARNGETLPSGAVMAGVQDLRAEAQTRPGILVNEHATLFSWLPLLAFSDQPSLLLEVVRQLPDAARHPRRLDDAVSALGYARGPEVERVLRALADHDAQFFDDREWVTALERHDSPTTWEYLLDALAAGKFRSSGGIDRWGFAKALAAKMDQDPLMREAVYRRLDGAADGLERSVLIGAVEETPDEEGILLLVRTSARHNEQPVGKFRLALENVVIARRPVEGWQDAFELEGQPASELRRKLFAMVINGAREAEVAKTCLTVIDKLRDQHGAVLAEPRHPEIATGRPWPII